MYIYVRVCVFQLAYMYVGVADSPQCYVRARQANILVNFVFPPMKVG